jgi:hypothetical protein
MTFNEHVETLEEIEIRHQDTLCTNESHLVHPWWYNFKYTVVGILFGIVFVKAEIISWFRIQEMFQLTSFFMYGVIGTAVVVGALSIMLLKKLKMKSIYGEVDHIRGQTIQQRTDLRSNYLWDRLGNCRSMPGTVICAGWKRI